MSFQIQHPGLLPLKPTEPCPGERQGQPGRVQWTCSWLRLLRPRLWAGGRRAQGQGEALIHRGRCEACPQHRGDHRHGQEEAPGPGGMWRAQVAAVVLWGQATRWVYLMFSVLLQIGQDLATTIYRPKETFFESGYFVCFSGQKQGWRGQCSPGLRDSVHYQHSSGLWCDSDQGIGHKGHTQWYCQLNLKEELNDSNNFYINLHTHSTQSCFTSASFIHHSQALSREQILLRNLCS